MELMDIKKLWSILLLLAVSASLWAAQVTGKVIDNGTKQAIDFANVSVIKAETGDGVPVTGTITDATGSFTLELKDGQYTLVVSFMGYSEQRKEITVAGKELNVGRIALREDSKMLQDVEVVGFFFGNCVRVSYGFIVYIDCVAGFKTFEAGENVFIWV